MRGTGRKGLWLCHWAVLQARFHALRGVSDTPVCLTEGGVTVVVAEAETALGEALLASCGVNTPPLGVRLVVGVAGVAAATSVESLRFAYSDRLVTPQHRWAQASALARLLNCVALSTRLADGLPKTSASSPAAAIAAAASVQETEDNEAEQSDAETSPTPSAPSTTSVRSAVSTAEASGTDCWASDMEWMLLDGADNGNVVVAVDDDALDDKEPTGAELRAHRIGLVRCDYFRLALHAGFKNDDGDEADPQGTKRRVSLPGVTQDTAERVIDWLHRGSDDVVTGESVLPLLEAARRLCIDDLLREAEAAAMHSVDEHSAPAVLAVAEELDLPRLATAARQVLPLTT